MRYQIIDCAAVKIARANAMIDDGCTVPNALETVFNEHELAFEFKKMLVTHERDLTDEQRASMDAMMGMTYHISDDGRVIGDDDKDTRISRVWNGFFVWDPM